MRRRLVGVTFAIAAALAVSAPAQAARDPLNAFRVKATPENKQRLATEGFDLTEGDHGKYIEIYATGKQARGLRADGVADEAHHQPHQGGGPVGLHRQRRGLGRLDAL